MSTDERTGGFEVFRNRAAAPQGAWDPIWRVGFESEFRQGKELEICQEIFTYFDRYSPYGFSDGDLLIDIGGGASPLTAAITTECGKRHLRHVVVDGPEMLAHLTYDEWRIGIPGRFPDVEDLLSDRYPKPKFMLAYSVLQYAYRDGIAAAFLSAAIRILAPGGVCLIGDIPNRDVRDRQMLASGKAPPKVEAREIRDPLVMEWILHARSHGIHAFVLPQNPGETMRLHRENLLLVKPHPLAYDKAPSASQAGRSV